MTTPKVKKPLTYCEDCVFWDRDRISCEGKAKCLTGESGVRYRKAYDFCSVGIPRQTPSEEETN